MNRLWAEIPLQPGFYKHTGMSHEVRKEIRDFTRDIMNVIGPRTMKKKYPTGNKYRVANDMLKNAYAALKGGRNIEFEFNMENDEENYFLPRFKTFIDEMLATKDINEKYLLVMQYKDNQNRLLTTRRLLTDDTARSIRRQILGDKLLGGSLPGDDFGGSGNDPVPVPFRRLRHVSIIDLNNNRNNPIRVLNQGSFWGWINLNREINLERYMIFNKLKRRERELIGEDNCLIYALRQKGLPQNVLDDMRDSMKCNSFPLSKVGKIAKEYNISLEVLNAHDNKVSYFWVNNDEPIRLLLYNDHYMLNEKITVKPFWLSDTSAIKRRAKPYTLLKVLKAMFEHDMFRRISIGDIIKMQEKKDEIIDLTYDEKKCCHMKKSFTPNK
jgi:hypothetical protein